jgi:hypothetical protein
MGSGASLGTVRAAAGDEIVAAFASFAQLRTRSLLGGSPCNFEDLTPYASQEIRSGPNWTRAWSWFAMSLTR